MTDLCAIQGQLVDVRNVGTHKCVKLTIHVPAEYAPRVFEAFGWPTGVDPVPVALARLNTNGKEREAHDKSNQQLDKSPASETDPPVRAQPRKWDEITPAQQAGIRCNEPAFVKFLNEEYRPPFPIISTEEAAFFVCTYCKVESRADIRNGEPLAAWDRLENKYRSWLYAPQSGAA